MANERKLTYDRPSIGRSPLSKRDTHIGYSEDKQNVQLSPIPTLKGYEKTDGVLSYSIICVISGGERKEKRFLGELVHQKNLHSLRVVFLSKDGQGLQPYQMQKELGKIQKTGQLSIEGQNYRLDIMAKVYLLIDVVE